MENKYFIPDIEDFHIGYECEFKNNMQDNVWKKEICDMDLVSIAFSSWEHEDTDDKFSDNFRVSYLTKEQIEAEGWEFIQIYPKGACIFQKGTKEEGCELTCDFTEHRVHFTELYFYGLDDEYTRTKLTWRSLECKDINTFRKICKLLKI